mmetsp:Transcript_59048/g.156738  ORF Transcript_59048/g.156738 Transcript_59048/m.156738 type:complete len:206 (-) Transcript_59048:880-1497(-)
MSAPLDPETEKTVDSIIDRLLSVRGNKPGKATQVNLKEDEIHLLVNKAREIFMAQPVLLELEAPLKVVGDVHGNRSRNSSNYRRQVNYKKMQASTRISCVFLSTVASLPRPTTCSLETTSIVALRVSSASASCLPTRLSTPRTSSCFVATTSALPSTEFTVSTTSASVVTPSSCGRHSTWFSTAFPLLPSLMTRSSASMVDCLPI